MSAVIATRWPPDGQPVVVSRAHRHPLAETRSGSAPYFTLLEQPALTSISEPATASFFRSPSVGCIKSTR